MCYGTLGNVELQRKDYAKSEQYLRKATQISADSPDALTWYRLALALDHQNKYQEALTATNTAMNLNQGDISNVLAKQERDRLQKLTGAAPSTGANTPATPPGGATGGGAGMNPAAPQSSAPPSSNTNPKPPATQPH
jgi:tetratricopeptide (TPR) repeat protein